jgi:hypothetical protein
MNQTDLVGRRAVVTGGGHGIGTRSKIPRGRFILVDESAAILARLVSQESSITTGAVFDPSGGRAMY